MTQLLLSRDPSGAVTFLRDPPIYRYSTILSAGVEQNFTLPTFLRADAPLKVLFSFESGSSVWVAVNSTATLPVGSIMQTTAEQNPVGYVLSSGDNLSFITTDTTVSLSFVVYVQ